MEIKIRKLKRAWAYCEVNHKHGKTPYEFGVKIGDSKFKAWLCADCFELYHQKFHEVLKHHGLF